MGLNDLIEDQGTAVRNGKLRRYSNHERQEELEEWVAEFSHRFPGGVEVAFIEVSPSMSSNAGKTYTKVQDDEEISYIRLAEFLMDGEDYEIKHTILKCMIDLYLIQNGHNDISVNSAAFRWLCGAVGCVPNGLTLDDEVWIDACEPFLEDQLQGDVFPDEPPEGAD